MYNDNKFPVEVNLGREQTEYASPVNLCEKSGKNQKTKTFYPTLYIEGVEGLPVLPKEGCLMVEFRRKRMSVEENSDGKDATGVTLEIRKLCLPEEIVNEGEDDMKSAMESFAKDAGVETGSEEPDADDDDEE